MSTKRDLSAEVSDLHRRGAERFGGAWLACHEVIAASYRQAGAVTQWGDVDYPLRYAACQIAWAWCSDLEKRDARS